MPSLEKMFNDILNSGTFPTDWNIGVIKPIYKKKGDCSGRHPKLQQPTSLEFRRTMNVGIYFTDNPA